MPESSTSQRQMKKPMQADDERRRLHLPNTSIAKSEQKNHMHVRLAWVGRQGRLEKIEDGPTILVC